MYAMQYSITLPADYDMGIIRRRVAARGRMLDDFAGLGVKAYLVRERSDGGSPVNQYAPFYLWNSVSGMNRFLWGGGGFGGIVADFGRPVVRHWTGAAYERGPSFGGVPVAATRHTRPVVGDPAEAVGAALDSLGHRTDGVHSTALAVDPCSWELIHFTLWDHAEPAAEGDRFEVLHLSAPEALPTGRHW